MKLEKQVCSLKLGKRLKELKLGDEDESLFAWYSSALGKEKDCYPEHRENEYYSQQTFPSEEICSAFTVAELYKIISDLDPHWDFNNSLGLEPEGVADFLAEMIVDYVEKHKTT